MQVPASEQGYVRFGPFTVDLLARELWNNGQRLPLQEKPFQILSILLEHPGQLVTREQLRDRLWPTDTFVDFDHSINTAIKKLREALDDNAEQPRLIETLPKRGYRFIGQLKETLEEKAASAASEKASSAPSKETVAAAPRPTRARYRWYVLLGIVVLAVVAMLVGLNLDRIRNRWLQAKISEQDTIVLADFSNSTGDPVFDDTLKQALSIALKQSPFLNVLPEKKVAATLRRMTRPPDTVLTHEVVRELCQRAGSKAYIAGSIAKLDNEYALGLKAVNCQNRDLLAQELSTVASKEQVLGALGKMAARMRGQLGESLATVQRLDVPLEATTSSLEALKAYSLGVKTMDEKGMASSIPFLKRAIELDPNFPRAYSLLSIAYYNLAQPSLALECAAKAYQLRDRASAREKLGVTAEYFQVTGEMEKAVQAYELYIADYPRDWGPYANVGVDYLNMGQHDKALGPLRKAFELAPNLPISYENLAID